METRFGTIPDKQINIIQIPQLPKEQLPDYLPTLTINDIDSETSFLKIFTIKKKRLNVHSTNYFKKAKYFGFGSARLVALPKGLNPELSYFIGYFIGDGYLKDIFKAHAHSGKFEHKMTVCDEYLLQVERLQFLFKTLFDLDLPIRMERQNKGEALYYLNPTSKAIHRFMQNVFEIPSGAKTGRLKIPKLIKQASPEIQRWFVRGLFDADGDTRATEKGAISQPRIKLRMCSNDFIHDIKTFLELLFDISVNGPYSDKNTNSSYLQIERKQDIFKADQQKIFTHPVKEWRLRKMCEMGR